MMLRPFWIDKITQAWLKRPIVWLSGVRRVGKTTLSKMFPEAVFLNCDLPSVAQTLAAPDSFYDGLGNNATIIFDEVHRIEAPSQLLKITADEYSHLKILETGSINIGGNT